MNNRDVGQRQHGQDRGQERTEDVDPEHHLLARHFVPRKYLVLRRVGGAVENEVDEEVSDTNEVGVWRLRRPIVYFAFLLLIAHAHEDSDTRCDHQHDKVFMGCESAAVHEDVHDHDRNQLARLPEHHCRVGDVRERGEAEWGGACDEDRALEVTEEERCPGEAGGGFWGVVCYTVCVLSSLAVGGRRSVGLRHSWFRGLGVLEPQTF